MSNTSYPTQISVSEAISILQQHAPQLGSEKVSLLNAYGRVLARDLASKVDHPSHDNSALDGYACRAEDTREASKENPVQLNVIGDVPAGSLFSEEVGAGQAVSIYTGAPIPAGADAIIRVEETKREGDGVLLFAPANPSDIRPLGQDIRKGETYLERGTMLNAASVGVAAAMGHAELEIIKRPKIGILATGDEVIEPGQPLRAGQVYNSNTYSVTGLVRAAGAEAIVLKNVEDDPEKLLTAVRSAGDLDLLLTSGGVSMGKYDFVRDLLFDDGTVHFWKVAQKPAGPVLFGEWEGLPVLGLPGNPVSSMIAFILLGRTFLHAATGRTDKLPYHTRVQATAGMRLKGAGFKETFARVKLAPHEDGTLLAVSTGNQSSGVQTSMLLADALAVIPPHTTYIEGDGLEAIELDPYLR